MAAARSSNSLRSGSFTRRALRRKSATAPSMTSMGRTPASIALACSVRVRLFLEPFGRPFGFPDCPLTQLPGVARLFIGLGTDAETKALVLQRACRPPYLAPFGDAPAF